MTLLKSQNTHTHRGARRRMLVALPEPKVSLEQDAEWCVVRDESGWHQVRFHDYDRIYEIPGLYEHLFYDVLECNSPCTVCGLLTAELRQRGGKPEDLRALDLGAGNGMVGEELRKLGVRELIGADILDKARDAANRDRPGVYRDYIVGDFAALTERQKDRIRRLRPNALTCVAALGFGDIPPEVFSTAFNFIDIDGWVAFNIMEDFVSRSDNSGFSSLIRNMIDDSSVEVLARMRYRHRLATNGDPIHYLAIVGRKRKHVDYVA